MQNFPNRFGNLGTETSFAIAEIAANFATYLSDTNKRSNPVDDYDDFCDILVDMSLRQVTHDCFRPLSFDLEQLSDDDDDDIADKKHPVSLRGLQQHNPR